MFVTVVIVAAIVVVVVTVVVDVVVAAAAAMTTACNVPQAERITAFKPFQIRVFQVMRKRRSITRFSATGFAHVKHFYWKRLA